MKMKKILSIALALVFAIGMLTGCAGGGAVSDADISAFVDTDEKLTISWLSYPVLAGCEEGFPSELLIEDKFNVDMKPIFAEYDGYNDKKNALLQSGDIPDMIYEMDPMYLFADARDEYLLELPYAAIEKYAPTLYNTITELAPAAWAYSYYEGKNYGLTNINHGHMASTAAAYRADWLEKVGMDVPETLDELHDVLYAFTHEDPDGNGKDDTYGYSINSSYYPYYFPEIFGAYGLLPFDWQEADGEIVYGGLRPEMETVLKILADWYKEGIIYPGFVEVDKSANVLFQQGTIGYTYRGGFDNPATQTSIFSLTRALNPNAKFAAGHMIKGPEGHSGIRGWGYPAHTVAIGNNGEDSPVKATRILKMLETMYTDDELLMEIRIGKEGETYTLSPETTTSTSIIIPTESYNDSAEQRLAGYEFNFSGASFWSPIAPSKEFNDSILSKAYREWIEKYPPTYLTDVFYKVDIIPSAPTYIVDLENAQQALMSQVIKGKIAADQYIEEFTKIWEATGGALMLEEAKAQQEILDEIYSQIGLDK